MCKKYDSFNENEYEQLFQHCKRNKIDFINNSKNYNTINWIFHDGTTSQSINPVFKYPRSGTFYVKLETRNLIGETGFINSQTGIL